MITVYFNGEMYKMTIDEIKSKGWNVLVNKSNGYSHSWQEIEAFTDAHIKHNTIWCTDKNIGFVQGSSEVSFS